MFAQEADPDNYLRAERVIGDVKESYAIRGRYCLASTFCSWVAERGLDEPAFTNIGRWRVDEAADKDAVVYVPWLTVDIDDPDLVEAYDKATTVTENILAWDYDPKRVICSFSGSKGFHIQVDATQMRLLPFKSNRYARCFLSTFNRDVCGGSYWDSAVTSPRSLIRVTGSTHAKTGLRKRSFHADEFLSRGLHGVMAGAREEYSGFDWPDGGKCLRGPRKHLRKLFEEAESKYRAKQTSKGGTSGETVMDRIRYGVQQGEEFGDKNFHVGRENAAFLMGCALIENLGATQEALEKLKQWNGLNEPPLPLTRVRAQWRGAKRKMSNNRRGRYV